MNFVTRRMKMNKDDRVEMVHSVLVVTKIHSMSVSQSVSQGFCLCVPPTVTIDVQRVHVEK